MEERAPAPSLRDLRSLAGLVGNQQMGAILQRQTAPPAAAPGAYVPHRFCRHDGTPTNANVPEDEATCVSLLNAAKAGLIKQRARAETLLAGPKGPVRDFRYFFAKVYSYVTQNEIDFVEKAAYLYPSYVLRSVLYFEKIYEDNFNAWDKQKAGASSVAPEEHWKIAFQRADESQKRVALAEAMMLGPQMTPEAASGAAMHYMMTSVLESVRALTEGMKAHIRWDLPRAEAWVFNQYYASHSGVAMTDFQTDFMSMAGVFDNAGRQMQDDMAEKLGIPVNLMPVLAQDTSMRHLFDADMATERADTWRRAQIIQPRSGSGPYSGDMSGDVTSGPNTRAVDTLTPPHLRPNMDDSSAVRADTSFLHLGSDNAIRDEIDRLGRSGLATHSAVERVQMIRGLLVGGTYGDDENAILTVLGASLDAGDLVVVIDAADAWDLAYAFDGEEYTTLREQYFLRHYYARTVQQTAQRLIRKCLDGETADWEERMVVEILEQRADAGALVRWLGGIYPTGPDPFKSGLNKLEWQLDGEDEDRVRARMRALGLPDRSGYTFSQ
jgi:hypothetical protein